MKLPALLARLRGGARKPSQAAPASDSGVSLSAPSPSAQAPLSKAPAGRTRSGPAAWLARLGASERRLLVLQEDAAGLEARVVKRARDGALDVGEAVRVATPLPGSDVEAGSPGPLLAQALAELRARGEHPPKGAVLVSAAGLAGLVELPVDPAKPKAPELMLEMVRYELEPAIAGHNSLWTLGEVLAARNVLDPQGRSDVARAMAGARGGRGDGNLRFGETAMELGLAVRQDIDAALSVQQGLQILDNEIACGWRGYQARNPDGHASPHWLTAGLAASRRQAWLDALAEEKLQCLGILPRAALAGAHVRTKGHLVLALEIWPEQVVRLRLAEGHLAGLASEPRLEQKVTAEWLADLVTEWLAEPLDQVVLLVADRTTPAAPLAQALQPLLRCPVTVEAEGASGIGDTLAAAAARQILDRLPAFVAIGSRDLASPLWKRKEARSLLIAMAAFLGLLSWEGHAWWRISQLETERAGLAKRLESSSQDASRNQVLAQEARELDAKANVLRRDLARELAQADMLELLDRRTEDVPALIRALGRAIDPVVVLEAIRESTENDPRIGIEVRAWSPDNGMAQRYAALVQDLLRDNGLTVAQADLRSRPGRDGSSGFQVSFWLVPDQDMEQGISLNTDSGTPPATAAEPTTPPPPTPAPAQATPTPAPAGARP